MMEIYVIRGGDLEEDIKIEVGEEFQELVNHVERGELQFIDKESIKVETAEDGGIRFPDYIAKPLPLFSDKLKNLLERSNVDYIFYKPVYVLDDLLEEQHLYWLAVVPKLNCLDVSDEKIIESQIGRYKIFRAEKETPYIIFVTEELKEELVGNQLEAIDFIEKEHK